MPSTLAGMAFSMPMKTVIAAVLTTAAQRIPAVTAIYAFFRTDPNVLREHAVPKIAK